MRIRAQERGKKIGLWDGVWRESTCHTKARGQVKLVQCNQQSSMSSPRDFLLNIFYLHNMILFMILT